MSVPAFSLESRARNIERRAREPFDVLIVVGGINGAGVARDQMLRARQTLASRLSRRTFRVRN